MAQTIPSADLPPIERLIAIMHILREPGGCSWDAKQTHESLAPFLIEEAYEVAAAIRSGDRDNLVDELGDVLLQPVFHAVVADDFEFDDIARAICEKLIRRHPHVFSDVDQIDKPEAVAAQWEQIKATEKGIDPQDESVSKKLIKSANDGLPALMASQKIQKRVAKVGFDWHELPPVVDKIREELDEVTEALDNNEPDAIAEEIGDLLFATVNLARKTGHDAELLLDSANRKFVDRFQKIEAILAEQDIDLESASLKQMDQAWEAAKALTCDQPNH